MAFEQMQDIAPDKARDAVLTLIKPGGESQQVQRSFAEFTTIITQWQRVRQKEKISGWIVCDKGEFLAHWKSRGKKKSVRKRMWKAAIQAEKFKKQLAWEKVWYTSKNKKKKKIFVWVREQQRAEDKDIIKNTASYAPAKISLDKKAAEKVVLGKQLDLGSKKSVACLGPGCTYLILRLDVCYPTCPMGQGTGELK